MGRRWGARSQGGRRSWKGGPDHWRQLTLGGTVLAVAAGAVLAIAASSIGAVVWAQGPLELEVVSIVNQERIALGLAPLVAEARLMSAAEGHARWMADTDTFSHQGPGGSNAGDRALAAGYNWSTWGEVLAAGQSTAEEVVRGRACDSWCVTSCQAGRCDGWKQSPGHWNLLMSPAYRDIGVGYAYDGSASDPYHHWWAVTLASSPDPATPGATAPSSATATASSTPPAPTATSTATGTPTSAPPTSTATATSTLLRPTATPTATATSTLLPTVTATAIRTAAPATATATEAPDTPTPTAPAVATPPTAPAVATPTPAAPALIIGRVRVQTRSVWGDTTIYLDGVRRTVTGEDGWFVVIGVTAGIHTISAVRRGALTSRGTFRIEPGVNDLGETLLILGDVYDNDRIDLLDRLILVAALGRCVGNPSFQPWIDVDGDGCVTAADLRFADDNFGRVGPTRWSAVP